VLHASAAAVLGPGAIDVRESVITLLVCQCDNMCGLLGLIKCFVVCYY